MVQPDTRPPRAHLHSCCLPPTMTSVSGGDPFSPRSSVGSASTDSSCLPRRRIRCSKTQISVGDCRYQSASDALLDYLKQFEEAGHGGDVPAAAPGGDGPVITTSRSSAPSLGNNSLLNGRVPVVLKPSLAAHTTVGPRPANHIADAESRGCGPGKLVGKGLAGSRLVLGSNGISVAGTREDVEDLLTSKVSPQLQEEVTDTLREVKLRRLLKQAALKSKNQSKTGLQQEVEAALVRSAELLEKVTKEDVSSSVQSSPAIEASSVVSPNSSTLNLELEALLLGNTTLLEDAAARTGGLDQEDWEERSSSDSLPSTPRRSGHTYSYHTSRPSRSRQRDGPNAHSLTSSTSRCAPVSYTARSRGGRIPRASSIDSLLPAARETSLSSTLQLLLNPKDYVSAKDAVTSPGSSDSMPSNQSDPTDLLRQIRSRSMSPGALHASSRLRRGRGSPRTESVPGALPGDERKAPDWVGRLDDSVRKSVPSWVGEMNTSQVSDSVWLHNALLQDENNKRPAVVNSAYSKVPSWVGQAEESDVNDEEDLSDTSRPALVPLMSTPIRPMGTTSTVDWNLNTKENTADNHLFTNSITNITSDSRPGLNFSDLNASAQRSSSNHNLNINSNNTSSTSMKHVTFTDEPILSPPDPTSALLLSSPSASRLRKSKEASASSPFPPLSPHSNRVTGTSTSSSSKKKPDLSSPAPSRVLDSDYNGEAVLRNSILPQTARLRRSMDTFAASSENLRLRSTSSSGSSEGSGGGGASGVTSGVASHLTTRCSSLDTVALLTGKPLTRSQRQMLNGDGGAAAGDDPSGRGLDLESSSDGLDGDRPWERMVNTIKAPVPVGTESSGNEASHSQGSHQPLESTLSGGRQPGSMEALKNMLFKLQAEETSTQDGTDKRGEDVLHTSGQNLSQASMAVIPALENYDFKQEPGGHSLEKALVHLNRLKKLVKTAPSTSAASESEIKTATLAADGITSKIS
ncbi:lung adenoma susceptibility protein 2 [Elysia marginata]|uniref:Lung adenoma susceptibility protein 2 n=1 Tax=Elysia marginata TaxID=1093978 RepID=A0AAV4FDT5_9GAST|nr:lung adenoma susceptibility protein 2 [Elysia marginata]